jgi:hypothetical protein
MDFQPELPFADSSQPDGYNAWQAQRRQTTSEAAQRLGLPLGHTVEVWLNQGIRLRGILRLKEEMLVMDELRQDKLDLTVDGVPFRYSDMESCLRVGA